MNQVENEEIRFLIKGSASKPYELSFRKSGEKIIALCSCPASLNGLHCKHRIGILRGSCKGIISGNENQVTFVQSWLPGTDLEYLLNQVVEAEAVLKNTKEKLSKLTKKLALAMYGGGS